MPQRLNPFNEQILRTSVEGDLTALVELFDRPVSEYTAVTASILLRRLLIDPTLPRYLHLLGIRRPPTITALDLKAMLPRDLSRVFLATEGDVMLGGVHHLPALMVTGELPGDRGRYPQISLGLAKYLDFAGMVAQGRLINRRTVIRFGALALGGAHVDPDRTGAENAPPESEHRDFLALKAVMAPDPPQVTIAMGSGGETAVSAVHAEILAIAQHVLRAERVYSVLRPELAARVPPSHALPPRMNWSPEPVAQMTVHFDIDPDTGEWTNFRQEDDSPESPPVVGEPDA